MDCVTGLDMHNKNLEVYETSRLYSLFLLSSLRDIFTTTGRSQSGKVSSTATIHNIEFNYQSITHLLPLFCAIR